MGIYTKENETSVVTLSVGKQRLELPAIVQPGQAPGTVGVALGYGRRRSNKVGTALGTDIYPLLAYDKAGYMRYRVTAPVAIEVVGRRRVALMQTQHTFVGRQTIIQESILPAYQKDEAAGRYFPKIATREGKKGTG